MDSFTGKLAVVTGGGSGMGRELVRQLAAKGCPVAACDRNADAVAEAAAMTRAAAPPGVRVTSHACDVSDEAQVLRFRDELLAGHASDHVDLVFSNAGIGGGSSFISDSREEWERTFAIDWWGVYYCARVFLPLLIASGEGVLVNTSSVNGFWASLGPGMLIPRDARDDLIRAGALAEGASADELRQMLVRANADFRDKAPVTAAEAATIILDGVRSGAWRILIGEDAKSIDAAVRAKPEAAYDYDYDYAELFSALASDHVGDESDERFR
jgi:short chain dehydrogenase